MKRKGMRLLFLGDGNPFPLHRKCRQDFFNLDHDVRHVRRESKETQQSKSLPITMYLLQRCIHLSY